MTKIKCPVCEHTNDAARKDCAQCGAPLPKVRVQPSGPKPGAEPQAQHQGGQATFRKGQLVANRYTIIDLVGKGGMGCIYRVHDNTLKEQVALKTLLPQYLRDKMVVERFFNEARIARQLSHPNIVRVHDIGMAGETLYISMEYLQGKSLRNLIEELLPGERLPVKDTLKIMADLCTALEYAHQYTVHRDLKPENIMIQPDGTLKLMDFGISKLMTTGKLTATAVVMGTPHYMPPEQFRDSSTVDKRADIYSIGVILYEILTGNLPTGVPKPASQILRDVPPALDPIIAKCVEPDPAQRYADVIELKRALLDVAELLRGGTLESKKAQKPAAMPSGDVVRRIGGGLLIAAVAVVAAIGVYGLEGRRTRAIEEAAAATANDPTATSDRAWRSLHAEATELLGAAERFTANIEQNAEQTRPIFDRIRTLRDAAEKSEASNPQRAVRLARQALQCYAALALAPNVGDRYFLVLPGKTVDDGAFFMAKAPVSVNEFAAWAAQNNWPASTDTADGADQLVATFAFYHAQAFAAQQGMRVPSQAEWQRAFETMPNALVTDVPEWTRDAAPGADSQPAFGTEVVTVSVGVDEQDTPIPPAFAPAPYSSQNQQFAFRCAVPITTDPAELRALFGA